MGLEQGFALGKPASEAGKVHLPLTIALALSGDLMAKVDENGKGLTLTDRAGGVELSYAGLAAGCGLRFC
jgi:hypothetical protein